VTCSTLRAGRSSRTSSCRNIATSTVEHDGHVGTIEHKEQRLPFGLRLYTQTGSSRGADGVTQTKVHRQLGWFGSKRRLKLHGATRVKKS
jgi:hypothetical protein